MVEYSPEEAKILIEYREDSMEEVRREFYESGLTSFFDVVYFISKSKGRKNGKQRSRRFPKTVVLLKPKARRNYASWNTECDEITRRLSWDEWAGEIYRDNPNGENPSYKLRRELRDFLGL